MFRCCWPGMLGLLGAGVLVHALLTAVRSRRRELALLKVIGFTRRSLSATVAVQATTLVGLAVIIGLPVGLGVYRPDNGHGAGVFADRVGVDSAPVNPIAAMVVTVRPQPVSSPTCWRRSRRRGHDE